MNEPTAERARTRFVAAPVILGAVGAALLIVGVGLGLSAAEQFRAAIQYGTSTCVTAQNHSSAVPGSGWAAISTQAVGLLCAVTCVIVELRAARTRPGRQFVLVVGVTVSAVALIATLLDVYVVHEISTCAALLST
jgi:hypothetical protein